MNKEEKPEYAYCVIEPVTNTRISCWYTRKHDAAAWAYKRRGWYGHVDNYCKVARTLVQLEVMDD